MGNKLFIKNKKEITTHSDVLSTALKTALSFLLLLYSFFSFGQPPTPVGFIGINGPQVVCEAATGVVAFNAPIGTAPFTFEYTLNGGAPKFISTTGISNVVSMNLDTVPGIYTYSMVSVSDANYGPTPQSSPATAPTITVQALPAATSVGGSTLAICPDGGMLTVGAGEVTYANGTPNWGENGAGSIISGGGGATPTFQSSLGDAGRTIVLTLNVNSNNTCSTYPAAIVTYSINVLSKMNVDVNLNPKDEEFCFQEAPAFVNFTVTGGTPPYSFIYAENGINKNINAVGSNTLAALGGITAEEGPKKYTIVSVTDANCTQSIVNSPADSMYVYPLPMAEVVGDAQACKYSSPNPTVDFIGSGTQKPYYMTYSIEGIVQPLITLSIKDTLHFPHSTSVAGVFNYSLIAVSDGHGCKGAINQSQAKVTILELPNARFRVVPEKVPILRPKITVEDQSTNTQNWYWDFGDGKYSPFRDPGEHVYSDSGKYTIKLVATNAFCKDSTSQEVIVYIPFSLYVPSAFSPNNDDVNDIFTPKGDGYKYYNMTIYDRWGNSLFYTEDMSKGWDGRVNGGTEIAQMDAVVYVINIIDLDDKSYIFYGHVTTVPR